MSDSQPLFVTVDPDSIIRIERAAEVFLSLVSFVKDGNTLDDHSTQKATQFLDSIIFRCPHKFNPEQILHKLAPKSGRGCRGFTNHILPLLFFFQSLSACLPVPSILTNTDNIQSRQQILFDLSQTLPELINLKEENDFIRHMTLLRSLNEEGLNDAVEQIVHVALPADPYYLEKSQRDSAMELLKQNLPRQYRPFQGQD
ncbi:hypothetical protein BLNAU_17889 [Blattamonas nauphoetae]|uniref:Uncharacterized protein n=1 Tax=Blattamonas nauphoetae TaxID=2049346 RepID=A0ABQ9X8J0_9EUKA|nr:hypothetical protein BLNAU_17889 [Blattamonas nauphoetae]